MFVPIRRLLCSNLTAVVTAVIYGVFPPINFISSLVIAACLTPTDPIICAAIVGMSLFIPFA